MPIATPETYAQMLDTAKERGFAFPAINVTSSQTLNAALAGQNMSLPGGSIETGPQRFTLRLRGRVTSVEELGNLVLRESNGHILRVKDVARVEDGEEEWVGRRVF